MADFKKELEELINKHSVENESNTPDFILADFISSCLKSYNNAVNARDSWYGKKNTGKVVLNDVPYRLVPIFTDWEITLVYPYNNPLWPMGHNGKILPSGLKIMGVRAGKRNYQLNDWLEHGKIIDFKLTDGRVEVTARDTNGKTTTMDLSELV